MIVPVLTLKKPIIIRQDLKLVAESKKMFGFGRNRPRNRNTLFRSFGERGKNNPTSPYNYGLYKGCLLFMENHLLGRLKNTLIQIKERVCHIIQKKDQTLFRFVFIPVQPSVEQGSQQVIKRFVPIPRRSILMVFEHPMVILHLSLKRIPFRFQT